MLYYFYLFLYFRFKWNDILVYQVFFTRKVKLYLNIIRIHLVCIGSWKKKKVLKNNNNKTFGIWRGKYGLYIVMLHEKCLCLYSLICHILQATTLYCLVLEYASGGDLLAFIKNQKEGRLLESKARPFFRQLVSAIHFLHERGVAHR